MSEDSSEKQPEEFSVYEKAGKVDSRKLAIAFGSVLRELRQERKLTQEKFAFECELDRTYISLLELGHRMPSLATMQGSKPDLSSSIVRTAFYGRPGRGAVRLAGSWRPVFESYSVCHPFRRGWREINHTPRNEVFPMYLFYFRHQASSACRFCHRNLRASI